MFFDKYNGNESKLQSQCNKTILIDIAGKLNVLMQNYTVNIMKDIESDKTMLKFNDSYGMFWWNIAFDDILNKINIATDLPHIPSRYGWEWLYSLECVKHNDTYLICLVEHGRKYRVDIDVDEHTYWEESDYSKDERDKMVKDYGRRMDMTALMLTPSDKEITANDVYNYIFIREHFKEQYSKSMYTPHYDHYLEISSSNLHSRTYYEVGILNISDGVVTSVIPRNLEVIFRDGVKVENNYNVLYRLEPILLLGRYISENSIIKIICSDSLKKGIDTSSSSYEDALLRASFYTVVGNKLK
ncbi:MAG: hypothetical protein NC122_09675 [Faecalibacterium sp.]|nr:hypothetical protein [Ruminococcus sp.]MCM1392913.1 hypothetical protein [Ruminococcus sp.]MCM1486459.1 hypothetical protein [Faecalibacterium sp.]